MSIINGFSPLEFNISIKRLPGVSFRAQRVSIPGINASAPEQPTPFKKLFHTPDTLTYGDFSISFLLDENMVSYFEIANWVKAITFPSDFDQFKDVRDSAFGLKSDIAVHLMTSKKNTNFVMNVYDCFPTSISDIQLDTTQGETIIPEVNVSFAYNSFEIEKVINDH